MSTPLKIEKFSGDLGGEQNDDIIVLSLTRCLVNRCSDCTGIYFSDVLRRRFRCQCPCHLAGRHIKTDDRRQETATTNRSGYQNRGQKYVHAQVPSDHCIYGHWEEKHRPTCMVVGTDNDCGCVNFASNEENDDWAYWFTDDDGHKLEGRA